MFFQRKNRVWLSLFIAIGLALNVTGKTQPYLSTLSPYSAALAELEHKVFQRLADKREHERQRLENVVKAQIREVVASYRTGLDPAEAGQLPELIFAESQKYGYDPLFLTAVIITESSFYNWAKSKRGALGLMQLRPHTGMAMADEVQIGWEGSQILYEPEVNIALGTYYLDKLMRQYGGNLELALAAYNHGPTQINQYLRKGWYPKSYARKVLRYYDQIKPAAA